MKKYLPGRFPNYATSERGSMSDNISGLGCASDRGVSAGGWMRRMPPWYTDTLSTGHPNTITTTGLICTDLYYSTGPDIVVRNIVRGWIYASQQLLRLKRDHLGGTAVEWLTVLIRTPRPSSLRTPKPKWIKRIFLTYFWVSLPGSQAS